METLIRVNEIVAEMEIIHQRLLDYAKSTPNPQILKWVLEDDARFEELNAEANALMLVHETLGI